MMTEIPTIFDQGRITHFYDRVRHTAEADLFLINNGLDRLIERLDLLNKTFQKTVLLGARPSPSALEEFKNHPKINDVILCDQSAALLQDRHRATQLPVIESESGIFPFAPKSLDAVFSVFSLHKVNDLPGLLIQIRRALKPDGLFMAVFPGGETLYELQQSLMQAELDLHGGASPRVGPFITRQDAGALMQRAGFALPVIDSETVPLAYRDPARLLSDLKAMGGRNAIANRNKAYPGKAFFKHALEIYKGRYQLEDKTYPASIELIFMIGWSPAKTQQQALKPGSAEHSLADALETVEVGSGIKPGEF